MSLHISIFLSRMLVLGDQVWFLMMVFSFAVTLVSRSSLIEDQMHLVQFLVEKDFSIFVFQDRVMQFLRAQFLEKSFSSSIFRMTFLRLMEIWLLLGHHLFSLLLRLLQVMLSVLQLQVRDL